MKGGRQKKDKQYIQDSILQHYKNQVFKRELEEIETIVFHGTGDPKVSERDNTLRYFSSGLSAVDNPKICFHYYIDRDGVDYEFLPLENWLYHSSVGQGDKKTIGIELENRENKEDYTAMQLIACRKLIKRIEEALGRKLNLTTHDKQLESVGHPPKGCPGKQFPLDDLIVRD